MSKSKEYKDSSLYLREMQGACQKIVDYVQRTSEEEFLKRLEAYDAICMQFSHLGEQVSLLEKHTDKIISHFPDEVDWPAIKALRNRIDHTYATIDAVSGSCSERRTFRCFLSTGSAQKSNLERSVDRRETKDLMAQSCDWSSSLCLMRHQARPDVKPRKRTATG
jgi:uncharacterized protein with HEPN domain